MTPYLHRTARELLGWSRDTLSAASGVPIGAAIDAEQDGRPVNPEYARLIRETLEAAGVEFTNGDAPGVRLRKAGTVSLPVIPGNRLQTVVLVVVFVVAAVGLAWMMFRPRR